MIFIKSDLLESDYKWNTDLLHAVLVPTQTFFNRFNGDSILRMMNLFNSLVANLTLRQGRQLEYLLAKELPQEINDEIGVFNWLKEKYAVIMEE